MAKSNRKIIFDLNNKEKIILESSYPIYSLYPCDKVIFYLIYNNNKYIIERDCIQYALAVLKEKLNKALVNQLPLHESINQNVGFLWNEYLQNKPGFVEMRVGEINHWIGIKNLLWSTPGNIQPQLDVWIYNDEKGSIVFEVTPGYAWHFVDLQETTPPVSYQEFVQNFKPLYVQTVSSNTAKQWLEQAENILKKVKENAQESEK